VILVTAAAMSAVLAIAIQSSWADGASGGGYGGSMTGHDMGGGPSQSQSPIPNQLKKDIANARSALAPYANDLGAAKAAGYSRQITPMMPDMGYHYMDPSVTGFDVRRPPILVYERRDGKDQLAAAEWVFGSKPAKAPLAGAKYGSFPAACHYEDGTFVAQKREKACAPATASGSAFTFWHPDLVTLHLWLFYPNPDGLFNSTNPLIAPFNRG
jgi:hypothetical protein